VKRRDEDGGLEENGIMHYCVSC